MAPSKTRRWCQRGAHTVRCGVGLQRDDVIADQEEDAPPLHRRNNVAESTITAGRRPAETTEEKPGKSCLGFGASSAADVSDGWFFGRNTERVGRALTVFYALFAGLWLNRSCRRCVRSDPSSLSGATFAERFFLVHLGFSRPLGWLAGQSSKCRGVWCVKSQSTPYEDADVVLSSGIPAGIHIFGYRRSCILLVGIVGWSRCTMTPTRTMCLTA